MDAPWRGTIAPEMSTEMSALDFLFSPETNFCMEQAGALKCGLLPEVSKTSPLKKCVISLAETLKVMNLYPKR